MRNNRSKNIVKYSQYIVNTISLVILCIAVYVYINENVTYKYRVEGIFSGSHLEFSREEVEAHFNLLFASIKVIVIYSILILIMTGMIVKYYGNKD